MVSTLLVFFVSTLTAIAYCFTFVVVNCQAVILDRYDQRFATTRFTADGVLNGNEYFGNAVDLYTYGGSSCFTQGCRILTSPYSGDSSNNNSNTNTARLQKRKLNLTYDNIETCFHRCLETNLTNLIEDDVEVESLSCEWNRFDRTCSVSNLENVYCWNGMNYTDYYTYINTPHIPCTSKTLCSSNNSKYFSFQYANTNVNNNMKKCEIRSRKELLLVGAKNDGISNTILNSGAATLYIRKPFTNGTWEFVDVVKPKGTTPLLDNDKYGACVHIFNKKYIFVSATHDDIPGHTNQYNTGVVYFFTINYVTAASSLDGTYNEKISKITVVETQKIFSPSLVEKELFGSAIASDNQKWLAVASLGAPSSSGSVHMYKLNHTNATNPHFVYVETLHVNGTTTAIHFGKSISISGKTMAIGADAEDVGGKLNQGCVYVYELNATWQLKHKITASDGSANDFFGFSLSLNNDDKLLIGSHHDDNINGGVNPGAVYYYERASASSWDEIQKIILAKSDTDNYFGVTVSHSTFGEMVAIGSTGDISKNGSVYLYTFNRAQNQYARLQKVTHSNASNVNYHRFGSALQFSNSMVVVGAELEDNRNKNKLNTGMVDLFNFKPNSLTSNMVKTFRVVNTYIEIEIIPLDAELSYQPVLEYIATTGQNSCEMQKNGICWKRHFNTVTKTLNNADNTSSSSHSIQQHRRYFDVQNDVHIDNHTKHLLSTYNINYTLLLNMTNLMNGEPYYVSLAACSMYGCGPSTTFYGPFVPAQPPNKMVNLIATPDDRTLFVTAPIPSWDGGAVITSYTAIITPGGSKLTNNAPQFTFSGLNNGETYSVQMYATNWAGNSHLSEPSNSVVPAEIPGRPTIKRTTIEDGGFTIYYNEPSWDGGGAILYYLLIRFRDDNYDLFTNGIVIGNSTDARTSIRVTNLANYITYNVTIQAVNWQGRGNYSAFTQLRPIPAPTIPTTSQEMTFITYALITLLLILGVGIVVVIVKKKYDEMMERQRLLKVAPLENNRKYFTD